jgi:hypothetical protein
VISQAKQMTRRRVILVLFGAGILSVLSFVAREELQLFPSDLDSVLAWEQRHGWRISNAPDYPGPYWRARELKLPLGAKPRFSREAGVVVLNVRRGELELQGAGVLIRRGTEVEIDLQFGPIFGKRTFRRRDDVDRLVVPLITMATEKENPWRKHLVTLVVLER